MPGWICSPCSWSNVLNWYKLEVACILLWFFYCFSSLGSRRNNILNYLFSPYKQNFLFLNQMWSPYWSKGEWRMMEKMGTGLCSGEWGALRNTVSLQVTTKSVHQICCLNNFIKNNNFPLKFTSCSIILNYIIHPKFLLFVCGKILQKITMLLFFI